MVRHVISDYGQLKGYQPRIAVIEDNHPQGAKKIVELIKKSGAKPMIIPRFLSERLLASQEMSKAEINRVRKAASLDEVREFDQEIATATRLHLQYITRKLTFVDAVILPGSIYDIPPSAYHDTEVDSHTNLAPPMDVRFQTELMMADYALHTRKIPLLGISGGMQLIVVKTGGKLVQHVETYDDFANQVLENGKIAGISSNGAGILLERISAKNKELLSKLSPNFKIVKPKSIIGVMLNQETFESINSRRLELLHLHHQGVRPNDINSSELIVTATTEDGQYVEAVEHKHHPFCFGTQFHPEYSDNLGLRMITEMVEYARQLKALQFDKDADVPAYVDMHADELPEAYQLTREEWKAEELRLQ
ncbi:MAG: gamma-glutamyl-gamma-aminobutyrate hydrolase family protein [Rickettsiales bacterium]|nr:gamma-glutamyl-gamma-aminobutyrate hydrolase family protein [Rickettsiales bacterium]